MFRVGAAFTIGFVLIVVEAFIVMELKNYRTISFGSIDQFVNVWAMNFFLVFAILTDIHNWLEEQRSSKARLNS